MARRAGHKRASTPPITDDNPALFFSSLSRAAPLADSEAARDAAERATSVRRDAGIGGIRTEGGAPKRRRVGQGLVLARKFNELARMFDAVTTVADLRMRRGEPPLFSAIVTAAANVYGKTADDADGGKNINADHVRQMEKMASDMIRFVDRGRSSTIEVIRPANEGPQRMNPMALQSRRSREFRKRLVRVTRRHYQRFLNRLPPEQRPDHDAASAVTWDPRFDPNSIPDIPLAGSSAPAAAAPAAAAPPAPAAPAAAAARGATIATSGGVAAVASCADSTPGLVTPDPVDIRCTTGDTVEVQYGSIWYPAVVREMQGARGSGAPPRLLVHVIGWDASTDAWEPLASTRLRRQQAPEDPEVPRRPMPPALAAVMAEQRHAHNTVSGINVLIKAKEVALKTQRREDLFRVSQDTITVSGLPLLADMIKFLFKSTERTAMYIDELAFKLLTTHKKVGVTAKIIDEQLKLLIQHAPEWCQVSMVGGRELFNICKGLDARQAEKVWTSVRPKLKDLVNQKRAEARALAPSAASRAVKVNGAADTSAAAASV